MKKFSIALFVYFTLAADLKVTLYPYIHWILWLSLIVPFMTSDFLKKGIHLSIFFFFTLTLFFTGFFMSFLKGGNFEGAVQLIKFLTIFLTIYYFIYYKPLKLQHIFIVINMAMITNLLFLVMGLVGITPLAQILTTDGRWGTIFNYPGSLAKIGVISFLSNLTFIFWGERKKTFFYIVMAFLSLIVIFMDGSRTAFLILVPLLGFISVIIIREYKIFSSIKSVLIVMFALLTILGLLLVNYQEILTSRIAQNIDVLLKSQNLSEGLRLIDPPRYNMLHSAINDLGKNPFLGNGSFSTVGDLNGIKMVVHNTYLQLWGDYGLFGLLGYMTITIGWLFLLPNVISNLIAEKSLKLKAGVYAAILILFYFNLNGLFHPYSTELSEWIIFILSLSIYVSFCLRIGEKIEKDENGVTLIDQHTK